MSLPLSPSRLAAIYDALRICPPFCSWGMPPSSAVKFIVGRKRSVQGEYHALVRRRDVHFITISARTCGHWETISSAMAHEMIHLYQCVKHLDSTKVQHNAHFMRCAKRVCRVFGWDVNSFC